MSKSPTTIDFPQVSLTYPIKLPNEKLIMLLGGRTPSVAWLEKLAVTAKHIWAIDKGLDICYEANIIPTRFLGDSDSVNFLAKNWAKKIGIANDAFPTKKDFTDTQLALDIAGKELGNSYLITTAVFGGRLDHTFSTLYTLAHSSFGKCCALIDDNELVVFLHSNGECKFNLKEYPKYVSLLPLTYECNGINTKNLAWELEDASLFITKPYAVSNVLRTRGSDFSVTIKNGIIAVYICFSESCL